MEEIKIKEGFCYNPDIDISLKKSIESLEKYEELADNVFKLKGQEKIFLDTNVLLAYYQLQITESKKILTFFETYKDRIYITKHTEQEFIRHLYDKASSKIHEKEKSSMLKVIEDITGKLSNLTQNQFLSKRAIDVKNKIEEKEKEIRVIIESVKEEINKIESGYEGLQKDKYSNLLKHITVVDGLDSEEKKFVSSLYNRYLKEGKNIPGSKKADQEKEINSSGDFIILHELLKFAKKEKGNILFVTNDTKAKDWVNEDSKPNSLYVYNFYELTDNLLFIGEAKRVIDVDIQPVENIQLGIRIDSSDSKKKSLRGINLRGADLASAHFSRKNLREANLREANLREANLRDADLRGADLTGADLSGADLSGANLSGANLSGANLSDTNLFIARIADADFFEANLTGANLIGANLTGANLTGANLASADLTNTDFTGANLTDANLFGTNLTDANFVDADFFVARIDRETYNQHESKLSSGINIDKIIIET